MPRKNRFTNYDEYMKYTEQYNMPPFARQLFDDKAFQYATYQKDSVRAQNRRVRFYNDDGELVMMTEIQACQLLLMNAGYYFYNAHKGEDWFGTTFPKAAKMPNNFYYVMKKLFPTNTDCSVIKDKFFKAIASRCDGWVDDNRNFLRSVLFGKICHFDLKRRYEQVGVRDKVYTEEEVAALNEQYYHEEVLANNGFMATVIDREVVAERTADRLFDTTGWKYDYTEFDPHTAKIDKNAVRIAKLMLPELVAAIEAALLLLQPGSIKGNFDIKDENMNPLCKTFQYERSVRRGLTNFEKLFRITPQELMEQDIDKDHERNFIHNQIRNVVTETNMLRGKKYSEDEMDEVVNSLVLYYHLRTSRVEK